MQQWPQVHTLLDLHSARKLRMHRLYLIYEIPCSTFLRMVMQMLPHSQRPAPCSRSGRWKPPSVQDALPHRLHRCTWCCSRRQGARKLHEGSGRHGHHPRAAGSPPESASLHQLAGRQAPPLQVFDHPWSSDPDEGVQARAGQTTATGSSMHPQHSTLLMQPPAHAEACGAHGAQRRAGGGGLTCVTKTQLVMG